MREYVTQVEEANADPDEVLKGDIIKVDGKELRYYRPGDGQLAVLMASSGKHSRDNDRIAGLINFFHSVLDKDGASYIEDRLLDREDGFGIKEVTEIMEDMVEEWGGRPTKRSSGSTQLPRTTGQKSTETTPALIS